MPISTLLLLAALSAPAPPAAVPADSLNYDEAAKLATRDSASLSGSQMVILVRSLSNASKSVREHCPEPMKAADFAPFTVILELGASGKITRTWLNGDTAVAVCFNQGMRQQVVAKPPHAPFYMAYDMYWQH